MTELPILVTLVLGFLGVIVSIFNQNKRFDDVNKRFDGIKDFMNRRFDEVLVRLDRIEDKQDPHEHRIMRLEEPTIRR